MIIAILIAAGLAGASHLLPFPFLFEVFDGDLSAWRMDTAPGDRVVYLTFDDGPNPRATPALLDLLREKDVHATFFLIDEHVTESTAPIVRRMFEEGHAVGLHSADRWLMLRTPSGLADRLQGAADHIERAAGRRPCPVFRPHAGWRSVPMLLGLNRQGYKLVGWSWLSFDWVWFRKRTGERISKQVLSHASPGQIIVLHDGHHRDPAPDRQYTIEAAGTIINGLRNQGYRLGTICPA
jgi:peptidoglycan/xylan/chitin deacetylase (PgdA/CDA1 family)